MKPASAKIIQHSSGMGAPTADMVRQRARELAQINGHEEFSDEDWREAKRELHGGHEPLDTNGEMNVTSLVSERDMIVSSVGHQVEKVGSEDGGNVAEELIAEGMDEAVHEQMLASRREDREEDKLDEEQD